jgi:hypothetical protein
VRPRVQRLATVTGVRVAQEVGIGAALVEKGCKVRRKLAPEEVGVARPLAKPGAQRVPQGRRATRSMVGRQVLATTT